MCHPQIRTNRRLILGLLCTVLGGLALLFWSQLKLVTGVPRTAYAEPEHRPHGR